MSSIVKGKRLGVLVVFTGPIIVGTITTFVIFNQTGAAPDSAARWGTLLELLIATSILTAVNLLIRWVRWHFLLRRFGVFIPGRRSLYIFALLLPAIMTPFMSGEVLLALFLKGSTRKPLRTALLVWLTTRALDLLALLGLMHLQSWSALYVLSALTAAGLVMVVMRQSNPRDPNKWGESTGFFLISTGLSLLAWTLPIASLHFATRALGTATTWNQASRIFGTGTLVGIPIPGGIFTAGHNMIQQLVAVGLTVKAAVQTAAVVRGGTVCFGASFGLCLWALTYRRAVSLARGTQNTGQSHFDELSSGYSSEIPVHIRERLIKRKTALILQVLRQENISPGSKGLDLGCGHAWYATTLASAGYAMYACDASVGQIREARLVSAHKQFPVTLCTAEIDNLPYADNSFDFVYSINVLHHIPDDARRQRGWLEVVRVLKPGGVFVLHEINVRNPLFRLYMSYMFPLINQIDDGTESWLFPLSLPDVPGADWKKRIHYFTFIPDFLPKKAMRACEAIERFFERTPTRVWSAHYMAVLTKIPLLRSSLRAFDA